MQTLPPTTSLRSAISPSFHIVHGIRRACGHRGRDAQRLVNAAEIVTDERECQRVALRLESDSHERTTGAPDGGANPRQALVINHREGGDDRQHVL